MKVFCKIIEYHEELWVILVVFTDTSSKSRKQRSKTLKRSWKRFSNLPLLQSTLVASLLLIRGESCSNLLSSIVANFPKNVSIVVECVRKFPCFFNAKQWIICWFNWINFSSSCFRCFFYIIKLWRMSSADKMYREIHLNRSIKRAPFKFLGLLGHSCCTSRHIKAQCRGPVDWNKRKGERHIWHWSFTCTHTAVVLANQ